MDLPWTALVVIAVITIILLIIHTQTSSEEPVPVSRPESPKLLVPEYMRRSQPQRQNGHRRKWIDNSFKDIQYLDTTGFPEIGGELYGIPTRNHDLGRIFVGTITYIEPAGSSNDGRTFRVTTDLCPASVIEGSTIRTPFLIRVYLRLPYHPA